MPSMLPRVLFVDHTAKLGGAELSLLTVAQAFRDTSRVVLFEEGPFLDRLRRAGIDATVLPVSRRLDGVRREGSLFEGIRALPGLFGLVWRLARLARSYDVLLANSQKSMLVAALAGCLARRPVIWHLRDLMSPTHFGTVQRRVATTMSNLFISRTIANSRATRDALVANGGSFQRIAVVHNGIDVRPFQSVTAADVSALRHELRLPPSGVVGVFSRLSEWKGQHVLLEALRDLPDVTALLVGDALFPKDEHYAAQLRSQIKEWRLEGRVRMLGFRDDVPVLMRLCDAILHTSTAPEPFGRVIVEGMMAGRPVIATSDGGPAEIIVDGETGLLVPGGRSAELRAAIRSILDKKDFAQLLATNAGKSAHANFSVKGMVTGIHRIIEEVASPDYPLPATNRD